MATGKGKPMQLGRDEALPKTQIQFTVAAAVLVEVLWLVTHTPQDRWVPTRCPWGYPKSWMHYVTMFCMTNTIDTSRNTPWKFILCFLLIMCSSFLIIPFFIILLHIMLSIRFLLSFFKPISRGSHRLLPTTSNMGDHLASMGWNGAWSSPWKNW